MNRMGLVLIVTLAAGCDSARTPAAPSPPSPLPAPEGPYSVFGIVVDADTGRPIENANVALGFNQDRLTTVTAGDGSYGFSFSTTEPYAPGLPNVLGLLVVWTSGVWEAGSGYEWMVQEIPRGPRQIVQNVRLRPRRTALWAGDSMQVSIDPDSSLAFDPEYAPWELASFGKSYGVVRTDRLVEWFYVLPMRDGVLTVDVRPENGGSVPFLVCDWVGCHGLNTPGPVSFAVRAGARALDFRVEIPRGWAPQRYVVMTSVK